MHQLEVKEEYCGDPVIHSGVQLDVGVTEHTFHILSVHLYNKVSDANDVDTESTEGPKEPVELNLRLRVATLALVPGYRPETRRPALAVFALLRKNPAYSAPRRVNC